MPDDLGEIAHRAVRRLRAVELDVLVFGPGQGSPGAEARTSLVQQLRTSRPGDRYAFPEDLIAASDELSSLARHSGPFAAETLLVEECDAVVVLLIDDPDVTGALGEQLQFLADPSLRHKFATLEPGRFAAAADWPVPPYILQYLGRLHSNQRYEYEPAELHDVARLLRHVLEWLDGIRWAKRSR